VRETTAPFFFFFFNKKKKQNLTDCSTRQAFVLFLNRLDEGPQVIASRWDDVLRSVTVVFVGLKVSHSKRKKEKKNKAEQI
jgi:hypothetical protein